MQLVCAGSKVMAKILLIEDDKSLCKVVSEWLKDEDHIVEVAEDGETGLMWPSSIGICRR
jgi:CheY-like chemotaxis protein